MKSNPYPVDSRTRKCCGGIGAHTRDCANAGKVFEEGGRIIVTAHGGEISVTPAAAAKIALDMLQLVLEVSPQTFNEPSNPNISRPW